MNSISQLAESVRQATDIQINKKLIREAIKTNLHFTYNGGMFLATPELLSFVATWPDEELFLADVYENPVKVNRTEFYDLARQHYQVQMNAWHQQYQEITRVRKV
jgi:hypothetical protein